MRLRLAQKKQPLLGLLFLAVLFFPLGSWARGLPEDEVGRRWLQINYYQPQGQGYKSEIINDDYFLSPNGRTSPVDEYQAFVKAMEEGDTASACRYPARMTLVLPLLPTVQRPVCDEFMASINPQQVRSVSLVFASGYFESPASYFGHTLLKFNSDKDEQNQYIFDSSLNYGAQVTDAMGPLYVIKGLTGGYVASYNDSNDTIDTFSYTNKQMRDVWEYELDLTPQQRTFMVEHAWELKRARFKYYFLSDNCATRIARLIESATGQQINYSSGKWTLPIQITQNLKSAEGLTKSETRHVSMKSTLRKDYLALSRKGKTGLMKFMHMPQEEKADVAKLLDDDVLAVVLAQLDVEMAKLKGDAASPEGKTVQAERQVVLVEMFRRPPPAAKIEPAAGPLLSPADIRRPAALQVGYIVRPGADALGIRYQASNNDLFTTPLAGQEASRFIMGAAEAEFTADTANIRKVTLLDIASFNTNPMPMRITGDYSWGLRMEYGPRNLVCRKCSAITAEGKLGMANRATDDLMLYTLWGAQLNHRQTAFNDYLMLVSENGALWTMDEDWKLGMGLTIEVSPLQGNPAYLPNTTLAYDIAPQSDLRFVLEHDGNNAAAMLRVGFYFN